MPKLPPLDENNKVIPHDHEEITNEQYIIRRVSHQHVVSDGNGGQKISSMLFKSNSGELSIDIKKFIEDAGLDVKKFVTNPRFIGSVLICVDQIRALGYKVGYDPIQENPYHGEIWGNLKSQSNIKTLLKQASWFVAIDGVSLNENETL